jgi:hypothetical protein
MLPHRADPFRSVAGSLPRVKRKQASGCFDLGGGGLNVGLGGAVPTAAAAVNRSLTSGRERFRAFSERQYVAAIARYRSRARKLGKRPRLGFGA